ncbi:MAG: hypothetical protein M3463_16575 [Verrucomicrobiota bacterium]|nr:hypothetical protein [Verrucomicrobiota bacterium]
MNFNVSNMGSRGFATLAIIFGVVQIIIWLVIAWRAMRAHEEIAASLDSLVRHLRRRDEQLPPDEKSRTA